MPHNLQHLLISLLFFMQISGPPFSPLPPGPGGIPGVRASRLLQGGTADARQQRAPRPPLQQLRDRVDHEGAGRHTPLRTADPGRVKGATDRGIRVEVRRVPGRRPVAPLVLLINWQPNPTPALSKRLLWNPAVPTVDCWQFSITDFFFVVVYFVGFGCLLLDSFNGRGLRRFQRRTDTACTLCFGHSWAIFKLTSHRHDTFVHSLQLNFLLCFIFFLLLLLLPNISFSSTLTNHFLFLNFLALILSPLLWSVFYFGRSCPLPTCTLMNCHLERPKRGSKKTKKRVISEWQSDNVFTKI